MFFVDKVRSLRGAEGSRTSLNGGVPGVPHNAWGRTTLTMDWGRSSDLQFWVDERQFESSLNLGKGDRYFMIGKGKNFG